MAYLGNTPTTQSFSPAIDYFSGNGSTTSFTLSRAVAAVAQVQVVIENVPQNPTDAFTVSGNTITFTSAPPNGTNNIYVYYTSPITQVIQPGQGTVGTAQIVDGSVTQAKLAPGAGSQWTTSSSNIYYNTGNVGVGTTSPSRNLSVVNSSAPHIQLALSSDQASGNGFELAYDGSANYIAGRENVPTIFSTNNTERMRIDASGRVTMPYQPAFSANNNGVDFQFVAGGGTKQTFTLALLNIGSCYNTSTGRFTAPVTGLYEIGFGGTVSSSGGDNYPTGFFYRNGSALSYGCRFRQFFTTSGQYTSIGGMQYVQLIANDYIEYYFYSQSGNAYGSGNEFQIFARLIG